MQDKTLQKLGISFLLLALVPFLLFYMKAEGMTEQDSDKILELINSVPHKETDIDTLHSEICHKVPESPLCDDIELLRRIDSIGREKGVPTRLLVGISFAESTIGTHFNKSACKSYNNWFGLKGRKHDTGKVVWFTKEKGPDSNGCWLYKFSSVEASFYSLANTISMGYKTCNNDTKCLSYGYVGNPNVAEQSWIDRVSKFY